MYKTYLYTLLSCIVFVGCDGCVDTKGTDEQTSLDIDKTIKKIDQNKSDSVRSKTEKFPKDGSLPIKRQTETNDTTQHSGKEIHHTIKKHAPELEQPGSPLKPFPDSGEDAYDPNSPQNAQPVQEDMQHLPEGHPLNARKIDKNDPDLLKEGSPANPIEDFTGEDISE